MKESGKASLVCIFVFSSLSIGIPIQVNEQQAIDACRTFCQRLSIPFDRFSAEAERLEIPGTVLGMWSVTSGEQIFIVSREGKVRSYTDGKIEAAARRQGNRGLSSFPTAQSVWNEGLRLLSLLGAESAMSQWNIYGLGSGPTGKVAPGLVSVSFQAVAHGIETKGVGNVFEVVLTRGSGQIARLAHSTGWTYDPPRKLISASEAKSRAIARVHAVDPSLVSASPTVIEQYAIAVSGFGCTRRDQLFNARRIRYAYTVHFSKCFVFIDAETGESLGGKRKR